MFYPVVSGSIRALRTPALIVLLCMLSCGTPPLLAAESATAEHHEDPLTINPQLDLASVLQQVVALHPQQALLAAYRQLAAARHVTANSRLPLAPAISVFHQNDALLSGRNERDFQADIELPIWLPGQRDARQALANLTDDTVNQDAESLRLIAAELLRNAVWDIRINRNEVALYRNKRDTARSIVDDVTRRFRAGEVANIEVMQASQERLLAEHQLVTAEAELMHAHYRYQQLTGLQEMPERLEERLSPVESYAQSPVWLAAEARVRMMEGERNLVMVERRENPQLIVNARSAQGAFDSQYNQSVGFRIRIPLQSEVRSAPLLAQAETGLAEARSQLETLRRYLNNALHEAEHNLTVSRAQLALSEQQFALSSENARLARKAYLLGEIDISQLLRLQSQAFDAERAYTNQTLQVQWNIAKYNQAVGVLP